jgi:hypothetical protein
MALSAKIALGPAPVAVFDKETGIGGQDKSPASRATI